MTYKDRILTILSKEEEKVGKKATFTRSIANRRFKNQMDTHNTVMRVARYMADDNLLKRVGRGAYALTPQGRKLAKA